MDLEALRLKIEADTAKAQMAVETVNDLLKKQRKELKANNQEAEKGGDDAVKAFSKWSSAYYRALGLVKQFGAAIKDAYGAAAEGAKIQAAESFFQNAGRSIEDLRVATGNMISDAELMKRANLADSMGISMDTFKTLAKVAQASALKTGQSFDYMFESIIVGTARSSRLLLDNLGIIISVDEANQNYAKTQLKLAGDTTITNAEINAFVRNMDDAAKKVAFADEVQRKATGTLEEYAKAGANSATSFAQFDASLANMISSLQVMAAEMLGPIIPKLTSVIDGFKALFALGGQGSIFAETIWTIGRAVAYVASGGKDVGESAGMTQAKTDKIYDRNQLLKTGFTVKSEIEAQLVSGESLDYVIKKFLDLGSTGSQVLDALVGGFLDINKQSGSFFGEWKKSVKETEKILKTVPGAAKAGKKASKEDDVENQVRELIAYHEKWANYQADIDRARLEALSDGVLDSLTTGMESKLVAFAPKLITIKDKPKKKQTLEEMLAADALEKLAEEAHNAELAFRDWAKSAAGSITTGLATGTGAFEPLLASFAGMAGDAISGLLSTALGAAGGGAVGAIVAALLPVIGSLLDDLKPVGDLLSGVATGLANFVKLGLSELLVGLGTLAEPLQFLLGALGAAVGSLLRYVTYLVTPLIDLIAVVVGGVAAALVAINPVFDIIGFFLAWFTGFISSFLPMEQIIFDLGNTVKYAAQNMMRGAIDFNNLVVDIARNVFQMKGFGKYLKYEDFLAEKVEDNKDAVEENTKALRDLAREFRNMPAGYKVARTVYDAADAVMQPQQSVVLTMSETAASAVSRRWRT